MDSAYGIRQGWVMAAFGCLIVGFILFPLYWMTNVSLQPRSALLATELRWLPIPPLISNYAGVLGEQAGNILTSCVVALSAAILSLLIAAPAAYALVVFRLRWLTFFVLMLLVVQMIPHVVMANALYAIYARVGLLNSHVGLILADATMGVPFAILILRAFMVSLPRTLVEAALVDGASHWDVFTQIILPLSRNGLITSGLFCFLFAWSDFIFALTMGTQGTITPITLGIYKYIGNENTSWSSIMAAAVIAAIPPIVLLLAGQRYISAGLVGGAVKE